MGASSIGLNAAFETWRGTSGSSCRSACLSQSQAEPSKWLPLSLDETSKEGTPKRGGGGETKKKKNSSTLLLGNLLLRVQKEAGEHRVGLRGRAFGMLLVGVFNKGAAHLTTSLGYSRMPRIGMDRYRATAVLTGWRLYALDLLVCSYVSNSNIHRRLARPCKPHSWDLARRLAVLLSGHC